MPERDNFKPAPRPPSAAARNALLLFIVVWFGIQVLFPLRHLLYPGSPSWTEEGHRFAWQMKLRDKKAKTVFLVRDPGSGQQWLVEPRDFLMRHQASKASKRPDMILQSAYFLETLWAERGYPDVAVYANACVSLNGRPAAPLIDTTRDLTEIRRDLGHADWVLPLTVPFERPENRTRRRDLSC